MLKTLGIILVSTLIATLAALVIFMGIHKKYFLRKIPFAVTYDELRINQWIYIGRPINVLGVLKPLTDDGKIVNAVLVPDEAHLKFSDDFGQAYYIYLGGIHTATGVAIKEECFGQFVTVSGEVGTFGDISIENVAQIFMMSEDAQNVVGNCVISSVSGDSERGHP